MKPGYITSILLLILFNGLLYGQPRFGIIYPSYELDKWQKRYQKSNQEVLATLIPYLDFSEKSRLQYTRINVPRTDESDPFAFYTDGKSITMSAQSMMFLWDICLAYTWLNNNDYDVASVTDYVAMQRYQSPRNFPGGKYPTPLKAIGISRNVENDPTVFKETLALFNSARASIIAHELGHIYYKHPGNNAPGVSLAQSRRNERQADEFAFKLLGSLPEIPAGWLFFHQVTSHYNWDRPNSTHPISSARIRNMANYMESNIRRFARNGNSVQLVASFVIGFRELANLLEDEELQQSTQIAAQNATLGSLRKVKKTSSNRPASNAPFSGEYSGSYIRYLPNRQSDTLKVGVNLNRNGRVVYGSFNFGLGNGQITEGRINEKKLYFSWRWAGYTGKGMLEENKAGSLKGTWGYSGSSFPENGGGKWLLYRY